MTFAFKHLLEAFIRSDLQYKYTCTNISSFVQFKSEICKKLPKQTKKTNTLFYASVKRLNCTKKVIKISKVI